MNTPVTPIGLARDEILRRLWIDVRYRVPDQDPRGTHYAVECLGVIEDPNIRIEGERRFVDVVHWWPAAKRWTVTHVSRASEEPADYPVIVVFWQPMLPLPW